MDAGSWGAIQGANSAQKTNTITSTTPVAASGLWRAFPAMRCLSDTGSVDTDDMKLPDFEAKFATRILVGDLEITAGNVFSWW